MTAKAKTKAELIAELELLRQRCAALEGRETDLAMENRRLLSANQRLAAAEQQRAGELALINAVQQGLASKLDLQVIYDLVGDKIRSIFDSQGVTIASYRAEANWVEFPYYFFRGERIAQAGFRLGSGLTSHVIQSGGPLLIDEHAAEPYRELGAAYANTEDEATTKSWLGVPLITSESVVGVIFLENYEREHAADLAPDYALPAYHWDKAEGPAKAIYYLEKAGEQSRQNGAYQEALDYLSRSLALEARASVLSAEYYAEGAYHRHPASQDG